MGGGWRGWVGCMRIGFLDILVNDYEVMDLSLCLR